MSDKNQQECRLGTVGGQAVMEGVMMQSKEGIAIAVRNVSGEIVVRRKEKKSLRDKYKICRVPIIRGIVNFIEMMIMSFSTLTESADMMGIEMDEPSKFEKWLDKKFGKSIIAFASFIGTILGVGLALVLFMWLPAFLVKLTQQYLFDPHWAKSLLEGIIKIGIFVSYLALVSLIPDIKRVFMYHGSEHKTIFCYEKGEELTVENVKKQIRFHPRCGTSFMFVILIISILIGTVITWDVMWLRILLKILILPLIVGIGYEYIRYAGKHDNALTRILSAPGLWMQRITTKEPDDSMIEVAIASVKSSLRVQFPDYEVPYEKKNEDVSDNKTEKTDAQTEKTDTQTEKIDGENL
ncbi:MAG: DUF1385 domain-containing protein [Clostridia bacterium]